MNQYPPLHSRGVRQREKMKKNVRYRLGNNCVMNKTIAFALLLGLVGCTYSPHSNPMRGGELGKGDYTIHSPDLGTNDATFNVFDCNRIALHTVTFATSTVWDTCIDWPDGKATICVSTPEGTILSAFWAESDGTNLTFGIRRGGPEAPDYLVRSDSNGVLRLEKKHN